MKKNNKTGFTIVELMIAILIGIILLAGLITIFETSSKLNRTQNGLARVQENGRYIMSYFKDHIENAGFSSCYATAEETSADFSTVPQKLAWDIRDPAFIPGVPFLPVTGVITGAAFDPGYLVFGHECNGGNCIPGLASPGSDLSASVPTAGDGNQQKVFGTDVLTVRYLRGGRNVSGWGTDPTTGVATVQFSPPPPLGIITPAIPAATGSVLLTSCDGRSPLVAGIATDSGTTMTLTAGLIPAGGQLLAKAYTLDTDLVTLTFFVENVDINGRSVPALYVASNEFPNPQQIILGVDAFDVLYGVKDNTNATSFMTADQVQAMPIARCWPAPAYFGVDGELDTVNVAGCGWRSVTSIEIHILLNSIYNSSDFAGGNEPFKYSIYGNGDFNQTNLPSGFDHYSMHRKEFYTTIALKNVLP